jgi:hypothetical protein
MQAIDQFVNDLESKLPEICTDADLTRLGLASSPTLCRIRKGGDGPAYFRIRRKIMYLRSDVLAWVRTLYVNNNLKSEVRCRKQH